MSLFEQITNYLLDNESIDYIFKNKDDLEPVFLEFVEKFLSQDKIKDVPNLVYKEDGNKVQTEEKHILSDLSKFPFADKDLVIDAKLYPPSSFGSISAGRGCVWSNRGKCEFYGTNDPLRLRQPEQVVREISLVCNRYGTREFFISMSSLTADRDWAEKFCNLLIENGLNVVWNCYANAVTDQIRLEGGQCLNQ